MTEFILALYGFLFIMAIILVMAMLWKICCLPIPRNADMTHSVRDDVRIVVHPDDSVVIGSSKT